MCTSSVGAFQGQKRVSDTVELELQVGVSHPVWGVRNRTLVLGKSSKGLSLAW